MARSVGDAPGSMISLIEERSTIAVLACIIASPHSIAPSPERLNPLANSFSLKIKQQQKSSVIKSLRLVTIKTTFLLVQQFINHQLNAMTN